MGQHGFAKGFQRIRSYGVQATKTFAKLKVLMREAVAKVEGVGKGAGQSMARLTYRQRSQQRTGRAPLRCPPCQAERGGWKIWHPKEGGIYDELEASNRGK
jgi:hypothetical protein